MEKSKTSLCAAHSVYNAYLLSYNWITDRYPDTFIVYTAAVQEAAEAGVRASSAESGDASIASRRHRGGTTHPNRTSHRNTPLLSDFECTPSDSRLAPRDTRHATCLLVYFYECVCVMLCFIYNDYTLQKHNIIS